MNFTCFLTEVSQDTPHLCGESVGRHRKQHLSCKNNGNTCSNSSDLHFLKGMFLSDYLYSIDPDSCRQEIRQKSACRSLAIDIQSLQGKKSRSQNAVHCTIHARLTLRGVPTWELPQNEGLHGKTALKKPRPTCFRRAEGETRGPSAIHLADHGCHLHRRPSR